MAHPESTAEQSANFGWLWERVEAACDDQRELGGLWQEIEAAHLHPEDRETLHGLVETYQADNARAADPEYAGPDDREPDADDAEDAAADREDGFASATEDPVA